MPDPRLSRRGFLAAAGLSTTAVLLGCDLSNLSVVPTPTPSHSPALPGMYQTSRVILGEGGALGVGQFPALPPNPDAFPTPPTHTVHAAVYFPTDTVIPSPTLFSGHLPIASGAFPLLLYAHGYRDPNTNGQDPLVPPSNRDFTTLDTILSHLASYGVVCLAPDLSFLDMSSFDWRAQVLVAYQQFVASTLNQQLFNNQVQVSRVVLVGHSAGAGGAVHAGRALTAMHSITPAAFGLVAPSNDEQGGGADTGSDTRNVVVLAGTVDDREAANPIGAYNGAGTPKTIVTIPGANHYGYTSICPPDNSCMSVQLEDENGTITRDQQQQVAAAYLAAMVRYYGLGEGPVAGYLAGERPVEGLSVSGIQVRAEGIPNAPSPTPTPTPSRPSPGPNK